MMRKVALSIPVLLLFTIVLALFSVGTKAQSQNEGTFSVLGVRIGMTEADTLNVLNSYIKTMKGGCQEIKGTVADGHLRERCVADRQGLHLEWIFFDTEVASFLARTSTGTLQSVVSSFSKEYGKPSKQTESLVEWKTSDEYLSVSKQRDSRRGEEIVVFLLKM